jgi:HSP20 family protein
MDEQGTTRVRQENKTQGSQSSEDPTRGQRSQGSTITGSQGSISRQNRGTESYGIERRSQGSPGYFSPFSVTPGEFFTMSPITLMRRFTEDIDRAFGFGGNRSAAGSMGQGQGQELDWMPRVEVQESGNTLVIQAELPGLTEKDVRVETTDQGLLITGEKQRQQENEEGGWHHSEISYGRFARLIPLPENAKIDQARANFQNGMLKVTVPLPEVENKRRQIPIQGSGTAQSPEQSSGSATKAASAGR